MKSLEQIAKENGFKYIKVDASEFEDGVGACVGDNWVKQAVWYTTNQMIEELGLPKLQVKSADLDASVGIDGAKKAAMDWLKAQGAKWYHFDRIKKAYSAKAIIVSVHYGVE